MFHICEPHCSHFLCCHHSDLNLDIKVVGLIKYIISWTWNFVVLNIIYGSTLWYWVHWYCKNYKSRLDYASQFTILAYCIVHLKQYTQIILLYWLVSKSADVKNNVLFLPDLICCHLFIFFLSACFAPHSCVSHLRGGWKRGHGGGWRGEV